MRVRVIVIVVVAALAPCATSTRAAPAEQQRPLVIAAVGDLMLGSTFPRARLPPRDGRRLLAAVAPILRAADVAFGNLEGPLFDGGQQPRCTPGGILERNHGRPGGKTCWAFRMPARYGKLLAAAGFDVLSLANNHIDDFGLAGRHATIKTLHALGVRYSGPTGSVAHVTVRGVRLAVIAFATYKGLNDLRDLDAARALIGKAAREADLVMVSFHGGAEGRRAQRVPRREEIFFGESRGAVRAFAHAVIDAGADLVVGHGPHVLRGLEIYKGRLVAYSLGTFASYGGINVRGVLGRTMILEVALGKDGRFVRGRVRPVRQRVPGGPRLDRSARVLRTLRRLSRLDFGARAPRIAANGAISAP
ncbi:MAG: CapA family protein [Myxococcales bacterium]|nr:CapA family protein [Myxococcales bacterium]